MALFTFDDGMYEITALSIAPKGVMYGEKVNWSMTIKNLTGKNLTKIVLGFHVYYKTAQGSARWSNYVYLKGGSSTWETVSWANNTEMTFSGSNALFVYPLNWDEYEPVAFTTRCMPIYRADISVMTNYPNYAYDDSANICKNEDYSYFGIIDKHYNPTIDTFDIERVSDEADDVKTSIKLSLADNLTDDQKARMLFSLADSSGTAVTLNATQAELLTGIADSLTAITQTFGKENNYTLTLSFGDNWESTSASIEIPRSFANLHLSGCSTGGACFGGFCKSTEGNPMLECYYPAYFYGGIMQGGVKDYSTDEIDTGVKWVDGKTIYRKVIIIDSPAKGTNQLIDIGASGTIDKLIRIWGMGISSTGAYPMPTIATSDNNIVIFEGTGNPVSQVFFYQGKNRGITWAFGVVEYTLA